MLIESFAHLHFCNCVFPPAQGLTDYSLQAKFNPFPVFFFFLIKFCWYISPCICLMYLLPMTALVMDWQRGLVAAETERWQSPKVRLQWEGSKESKCGIFRDSILNTCTVWVIQKAPRSRGRGIVTYKLRQQRGFQKGPTLEAIIVEDWAFGKRWEKTACLHFLALSFRQWW